MDFYNLKLKFFPSSISNEEFVKRLNDKGVKCGKHTKFFDITKTTLDISRPWLLEIGDYCKITAGVTILAHDYSRSVARRVYGDIVAEAAQTVIGDNVFIGINSIILMGAHIGNNVIIGAGSVVSGNIPDNSVVAGNPAKFICTLDEYYKKRKARLVTDAQTNAILYKKKYSEYPSVKTMESFFPLYLKRDREELKKHNLFTKLSGDDEEDIIENWLKSEPLFNSYEEFLASCDEKGEL